MQHPHDARRRRLLTGTLAAAGSFALGRQARAQAQAAWPTPASPCWAPSPPPAPWRRRWGSGWARGW